MCKSHPIDCGKRIGGVRATLTSLNLAFTLIETLVVIAILAVLIALVVPVTKSVQDNSKQAACVSNLRQIGVALLAFASENDGQFPHVGGVVLLGELDKITGKPSWAEQIDPYLPNESGVFQCPADPVMSPNTYYLSAWAPFIENGRQTAPMRMQKVTRPSAMILAGDCMVKGWQASDADKDDCNGEIIPAFGGPGWHRGKSNLLFVDGHVSAETEFDHTRMTTRYEGVGYEYFSSEE